MILATLLAISSSLAAFLALKVKTLQKEHERLRNLTNEDSKVLFLKSRYASMGETLGNIAHQWKQPLNAIGTIQNSIKAALLFQGEISKEKLMSSVDTSFKLLQHLAETIDTFYSFLAQSGDSTSRFYLADELDKVRKITEYSFENSNINLVFELEINPSIQGNANELTHALLNLILNAKDAFDTLAIDNPTITVRVVGREETCTITVTDNAGGIRIKPIDMVFDMHITSKEDGSGLGLFMTKNIIEKRFGGSISVKNTKNGACFTIDLPYADYHEHYETITRDERLTLDRINQLSRKVIEFEEVEKNLRKWSEIFKKAHWAIAMHVGTSNRFDLTNDAFNALYGYSAEEMRQLSVPDLFTPESLPILSEIQTIAFDKGYVAFESTHKRRDGSTFPVSVELMVIKDEEGDILYHMANIWDLSEKKAAEERLLLKKFALDHIRDAVFLIDANARFHYVNEGACNALGYTREEMLHMSIGDVDPDWPNERWPEHWEELKQEGSITMELRHRRKDGTIFPVEVSANYIEYNGRYYNMAVARDITERKAAQEKLLLQTFALDQVNEAVFLIDENSMFHYVNEGACKALGYTKEELLRMGVVHLDPNVSIEWWRAHWDDIIALGTTLTQTQHIKKDGSFLSVEVSSNSFEYDGVWYSLAVSRDITERLALEAEKESRAIRVITENSPDIIVRFDLQGHRTYVNPKAAELFKIDMLGKTLLDVTPVLEKERFAEHLRHVLQTGEEITFETGYINAEGQNGWAHIRMVPELDGNGKIMSVLSIGRDMTELKNAYETLAYKERELRALAESSPGMMGAYYMRPDGSVCMPYASPNIRELFGITSEEIKEDATPLMALSHPDDVEMIVQTIHESAQTMSLWHIEYRIIHPTKGVRWMEGHTMPQTHPSGGVIWYGYVHDITERKQVEKTAMILQNALEFSLESLFIMDASTDELKFVLVNDTTCKTLGYSKEELLGGMGVVDIDPDYNTDRIDYLKTHVEELKKVQSFTFETKHKDKSGRIYPVEIRSSYFEYENKKYILSLSIDITERKALEASIQEANDRYLQILDNSTDVIYLLDVTPEGHFVYVDVNAAYEEVTGIPRDVVIGLDVEEIEDETFRTILLDKFNTTLNAGGKTDYTADYPFPAGLRTFHSILLPIQDESGRIVRIVGAARDITEQKRIEKQLQENQAHLSSIISTIPDMIWMKDENGIFVACNPAFERFFGAPVEEIIGKSDYDFISVEEADYCKETDLNAIQANSITLSQETITYQQDGSIGIVEVRKVPVYNNGIIIGVLGIGRDITDQKAMEEQIRHSEENLKNAQKIAKLGSWHLDIQNEQLTWSDETYRIFEFDRSEITDLHQTFYEHVHPEDRERVRGLYVESLYAKTSYELDHRIIMSDGSIKYIIERCEHTYAPDGTPLYSNGTVQDITERKLMEKELQDSHAFLTKLIDSLPDPIFVKDRDHKWLILNKANYEFAGIEQGSFIGKSDYDFFPKEEADVFWEKDEEVFKSGKVNVNEEYFTSSDGITHYIQTIKAMFVGSDGKEYLVGTIRDLSERKAMEDDLRQALEFNEGVISAIPDMLFEIAPDGTYVGIWAQNEELLIQQRTALLGKNFKEVLPPDVVITSIQAMKEVDEKGLSLGKTYSLDLPEGKRWFELSVSKKKMSGNYIALARDITDRKQAEEAIKELNATLEQKVKERTQQFQQSLEFSEGVINALPDLLFEIDINGIYLNVWARDEKILAAQKEFLIGHSLYDVLSKESADSVMEGIKEASAEGVSFGKVIKIDLPQGTRYFEESFSKKVSSNTFLVLSHDITDRVEADQKLRESEEMFRALVENSPDVISRYDLSMRRTYVNPMMRFLLDKPLDEILGKTPREFSPLPDVEVFEQLFDAVVQGKSELEYEGVFTAPWGEQRWGNQRIIPEFDSNHNVNGVMIIGRDMTERVETERRLKLLETAVNNTKDAVYIIDKDKSIIYVNNAVSEMLGYTFEELTQMKIYAIDTHLDSEQIKNITNELEKTIIFDTKHKTKDGRIINVEVALTLFEYDGVGFGVSFVKEISK